MNQKKQAILIADLGFGDAGKGTITDFLTRTYTAHTVVRYNGGPQAAHRVVTPDGRAHVFSQFGSGTFLLETQTLLSRFMLLNPLNLLKEERHLQALGITNAWQRLLIDRRALVITPFQKAANRLREVAREGARHGSCGEGIGECMADALSSPEYALLAGDLEERTTIRTKLRLVRELKYQQLAEIWSQLPDSELVRQEKRLFTDEDGLETCVEVFQAFARLVTLVDDTHLRSLFARPGTILFEGAQGVLLDEYYGFAPYTTWSTTTFANAETLLREHDYSGEVTKLGVLRAYATRHGAGPFPTEDAACTQALPDAQNSWNPWQHTFRVGHLDLVALRYALEVAGRPDCLAVTNLDRLQALPTWKICHTYRYPDAVENLSHYFEHDHNQIQRIHVRRPADLEHQEQLTQHLFKCQPVYHSLPLVPKTHANNGSALDLASLEEKLALPIAIASYGPTASDKTLFPSHL